MGKIIRISESQLDNILKHKISEQTDLNERGRRGVWKQEWNEEDQMLAMYNSLYGVESLGYNKYEIAEDIIGSSVAALSKQTSNFDYLRGLPGYDRSNTMQTAVYEKYKGFWLRRPFGYNRRKDNKRQF